MSTASSSPATPTALQSLFAGATAGAVEGFLTYPTEFVKTQVQLARSSGGVVRLAATNGGTSVAVPAPGALQIVQQTWITRGPTGFFSGATAMVTGNSLKAGVRFLTYDSIKRALRDDQGKLSLPRSILAGFLAGVCEGAIAVTPSEAIKTRLIQDSRKEPDQRQFKGLIHGTRTIMKNEGIAGIYRGLNATMLRQGANSAVRLSSYSFLRSLEKQAGYKPTSTSTFVLGATAGVITVYATMPFDVVKTRLQSAEAAQYGGLVRCASNLVKQEGVKALWKGTTPRLTRLIFSGGIAFTVYEACISFLTGEYAA